MSLTTYQEYALGRFFAANPRRDGLILEIGSDIEAQVCRALAKRTTGKVVGINPHPDFPRLPAGEALSPQVRLMREDGRTIPLEDNSVDAIFTVATVEHILGVPAFYSEVLRVLRPGGLVYADFAPIWSCHVGHHVAVFVGGKEARFWKPGRNPIPDFAHLIWNAEEMREFLRGGPCAMEMVDPIVDWIYAGDGINRMFLEDHLEAIANSGLWVERLKRKHVQHPNPIQARQLFERYGAARDFTVYGLEVTMRKPAGPALRLLSTLRRAKNDATQFASGAAKAFAPVLRQVPTFRRMLDRRHWK